MSEAKRSTPFGAPAAWPKSDDDMPWANPSSGGVWSTLAAELDRCAVDMEQRSAMEGEMDDAA